ncbi:MAG: cyclodeaminase/cyclohydrolase family protein [Blastocatellia bacterium]
MSVPGIADSNSLLSDSIGNFDELVAAGTPTPGGGSVAAYSGVLAASLGRMVCNLTIGKAKYAEVEPRVEEIAAELQRLSARLRELIAEDAESFEAVLRAYKLPKETDEQKAERAEHIQAALRGAIDVPFETAQRSFRVLDLLRELSNIGNPNALSDMAVGARLAQVAVKGASYNISVNLDSMSDRDAATATQQQTKLMVERSGTLAEEIEAKMNM